MLTPPLNLRPYLVWLTATVVVMLLLPSLVLSFAPAPCGMVLVMLLFYIVNPLFSVLLGSICARPGTPFRLLPLISAMAFLCGIIVCFESRDPQFLLYAAIYLALSYGSMLITRLLRGR